MSRKILIVDDELSFCETLREFLMRKGYQVSVATNGDRALAIYGDERQNVVLMDINMPGKNGIETLKELKVLDPEATVIMITAVHEENIVEQAMAEGALDYVTKPINLHSLDLAIRMTLEPAGDEGPTSP